MSMFSPSIEELEKAVAVVRAVLPETPQITWPLLNERAGAEVWVKHENHLPVGAFKIRGGLVYFERLVRNNPGVRGVIAATRGNHGQSIAFAAQRHRLPATIVVPRGNSPAKNAAMLSRGVELIVEGSDFQEALEHAQKLAQERGLHLVPSYDEALVLGVASAALELFRAAPELKTLYVPVGMGSGVCAAIVARDALGLKTDIVGVVAARAPAYADSFAARLVTSRPVGETIADGMACRVPDADALAMILRGASRMVTVEEAEIRAAMRALFEDTHNVAEGSGAAGLAGLLQERGRGPRGRVGFMLTGGNVDGPAFSQVLRET